MTHKLKKGDLVRVIEEDGWETCEYGWYSQDFYKDGRYGVVLEPKNLVFSSPYGYNTWKIRLSNGVIAVYPAKDLEILARG